MPSSSQIKKLGPKKYVNSFDFHGTAAKEDRIAVRKIKECGESFIVKIEKYGNVNHSPENPVWKIPGFCYLECINLGVERGHYWPANPLKPFNLIHADLIELPIRSYHKKKWVCMLMDDYSSYAYCFLLRDRKSVV